MEQLSIILTEKKNLGYVAIPYMVSFENAPTLTLVEQVLPQDLTSGRYSFSGIEKEIIEHLYNINEQMLYKLFSREKTLKAFYETLTNERIESHIRPYIEKKLTSAFELIAASNLSVFHKLITYSNLYISDKVLLSAEVSRAVFEFTLTDEELSYTLNISEGDKKVSLLKKDIIEITTSPAALLINHHLYRFDNIDVMKFRPFVEKTKISVPARSVEKYMSAFVENCVRDHDVIASGFDIKNKEVTRKAVLSLEKNLSLEPVLMLNFKYENRNYAAGTQSNIFVNLEKENEQYVFYKFRRDKEWEEDVIFQLKEMGLSQKANCTFLPDNEKNQKSLYQIMEWVNESSTQLTEQNIELIQRGLEHNYYTGVIQLNISKTTHEDWFSIHANITLQGFQIPFVRLKKNILSGNREYVLPDNSIFIIPEVWLTRFTDLMQFGKEDEETIILDKMHFRLMPSDNDQDEIPADVGWNNKLEELINIGNLSSIEQPARLNAQMRPYQLEGYAWMNLLNHHNLGGILADDMGLGKTLQTIALLTNIYDNQNGSEQVNPTDSNTETKSQNQKQGFNQSSLPPTLIVMPTSLIHNWEAEIEKFAPHLKVYKYVGNGRLKSKEIGKILRHYHVVLTTYGIIRNDFEYFTNMKFLYLILDEGQNIKNPQSHIYLRITQINSSFKLVLSGTPIENNLNDLWAQINFVNRGLLGNQNFFKNHFVTPITKNQDLKKEEKLRKLIAPFIMRRTKFKVEKDLPPVTELRLNCEMTPEQKKIYQQELSAVRNEVMENFNSTRANQASFMALQALLKLRMIANHPVMTNPDYKASSGKFELVLEHIENIIADEHKLLVFSSFVKDLELIETELKIRGIKYSMLTGSSTDRERIINRFTKDEECRVFLISLKAGGVGLNLTQADYVFMLNPWWNPAAELQAISRAHRIGQTKNVFVYKFITTDSIEEKIAKLQEKKLILADTFIKDGNPLTDMTPEQIKELFE